MDSDWRGSLHWSFNGAHVLLPVIQLDSFWSFLAASLLTAGLCLTERLVTFASDNRWCPTLFGNGRRRHAFWRAMLYWWMTLLRLLYMLIAMSFHAGLILVAVTTLAFAQFLIEYQHPPNYQSVDKESYTLEEPLLSSPSDPIFTRPRSKSKPDNIFIHPNQSNIARADAVAFQMGISGNTDRVHGNMYTKECGPWEQGKGREGARALMGHTRREPNPQISKPESLDSDSDS